MPSDIPNRKNFGSFDVDDGFGDVSPGWDLWRDKDTCDAGAMKWVLTERMLT
jgi:hypothetical protein